MIYCVGLRKTHNSWAMTMLADFMPASLRTTLRIEVGNVCVLIDGSQASILTAPLRLRCRGLRQRLSRHSAWFRSSFFPSPAETERAHT